MLDVALIIFDLLQFGYSALKMAPLVAQNTATANTANRDDHC